MIIIDEFYLRFDGHTYKEPVAKLISNFFFLHCIFLHSTHHEGTISRNLIILLKLVEKLLNHSTAAKACVLTATL